MLPRITLQPWRWNQHIRPKRHKTRLHGVISCNCGPPCDAVLQATLWPLMTLYSTRQDAANWQSIGRGTAETPDPYRGLPKNADCRAAGGGGAAGKGNNDKLATYAVDQARRPVKGNIRCQTWALSESLTLYSLFCARNKHSERSLCPVVIIQAGANKSLAL
jgi:hypothetical protein